MYCKNCGTQIPDGAQFCSSCGEKTTINNQNPVQPTYNNQSAGNIPQPPPYNPPVTEDKANIGLNILSFFIPIVGLILYFQWKKDTPQKAQSALICAIVGFVLGLIVMNA